MIGESLLAWAVFPAVFYCVALGMGLAVERVAGVRLPDALLAPIGFCVATVLAFGVSRLELGAVISAPLIAVIAVAGLVTSRGKLRRRAGGGWAGVAALAAYALYLAPVVLSGHWTWSGYQFLDDTSVQLLLADHLQHHGAAVPAQGVSTSQQYIWGFLASGYPLGSHALLGMLDAIVPAPLAALYQPYIASLAALTAMALATLARRIGTAPAAAAAAFAAITASLTFNYALQGNVTEMAMLAALAAAAAAGRELLASDRPVRAAAVFALPCVTALAVFSVAAVPFVGALALGVLLAVFLQRPRPRLRSKLLPAAGVAAATFAVAVVPALIKIGVFTDIARAAFESADASTSLGQLLRPLRLIQVTGVWLADDYRLPVPPPWDGPTTLLGIGVAVFALVGVVHLLRRRETGVLLYLFAAGLTLIVLYPQLTPYAEAKVFVLLSPGVVLAAAVGAIAVGAWLRGRWRVLPYAAAAVLAGAVLASDVYAYRSVRLAPTKRMDAMADVANRYRGGPVILVNEADQFAKFFMRKARINSPFEPFTLRFVELRTPQSFMARYFDLDEQKLPFVDSYELIMQRRSPDASRPPANFRLDYQNAYYRVWRRTSAPKVEEHLPLEGVNRAALEPSCPQVRALAARAKKGELLVAAERPETPQLDVTKAPRPPQWTVNQDQPGTLIPTGPGSIRAVVRVPSGGRYRIWVRGSFGRTVVATVDGREVGTAKGIDSRGQWHDAGAVHVSPGRHTLELRRGSAGLEPGDGVRGVIGPLALERLGPVRLVRVRPADAARRLCGRTWDWIERVAP